MTGNFLAGRFLGFTVLLSLATMAAAQTTQTATEIKTAAPTVATSELKGVVEDVEGNSLVVTMANGDVRTFNVPESRRFMIDGKELTVHELQPGTRLTATVTTTTTPVTVRTTTIKSGTVLYVLRNNVILALPNGETKQFIVEDDTRFTINGQPAAVKDLRKGMVVYAEKVVEEPATEITSDTRVVGEAPPPQAQKAEPVPPAAEAVATAAEAKPTEPAPAAADAKPAEPQPTAPKSASRVLLIALLGVLLVAVVIGIWMLAGRKSREARP